MLSFFAVTETEIEVCIGSLISKNGVFYAIQVPTVETVNKLRVISANIRFVSDTRDGLICLFTIYILKKILFAV